MFFYEKNFTLRFTRLIYVRFLKYPGYEKNFPPAASGFKLGRFGVLKGRLSWVMVLCFFIGWWSLWSKINTVWSNFLFGCWFFIMLILWSTMFLNISLSFWGQLFLNSLSHAENNLLSFFGFGIMYKSLVDVLFLLSFSFLFIF